MSYKLTMKLNTGDERSALVRLALNILKIAGGEPVGDEVVAWNLKLLGKKKAPTVIMEMGDTGNPIAVSGHALVVDKSDANVIEVEDTFDEEPSDDDLIEVVEEPVLLEEPPHMDLPEKNPVEALPRIEISETTSEEVGEEFEITLPIKAHSRYLTKHIYSPEAVNQMVELMGTGKVPIRGSDGVRIAHIKGAVVTDNGITVKVKKDVDTDYAIKDGLLLPDFSADLNQGRNKIISIDKLAGFNVRE